MDANLQAELDKQRVPTSVDDESRLLRAFFYGDMGAGKTTLASRLVENKGCIITTDSNWVVIQKEPEVAAKIDRYPYDGLSQLRAIAEANIEGIEPYASYDTLIWDTAPTGIERTLRKVVAAKKFKDQRDPDVASWTHYFLIANAVKDTVEVLNRSRMNIIYTAHVREPTENDRNQKKFALRPNGSEASYLAIGQEVSLIGWLYKEEKNEKKLVSFEGTNLQTGKSQIPGIEERTYLQTEIPELIRKWKVM